MIKIENLHTKSVRAVLTELAVIAYHQGIYTHRLQKLSLPGEFYINLPQEIKDKIKDATFEDWNFVILDMLHYQNGGHKSRQYDKELWNSCVE